MTFSKPKEEKAIPIQLARGYLNRHRFTWGLCINKKKKFSFTVGGFGQPNDFLNINEILAIADYIRTLDTEIVPAFDALSTITDVGRALLEKARKRNASREENAD